MSETPGEDRPDFTPPRPEHAGADWQLRRARIETEADEDGLRIDALLARRYDNTARALWQERIRAGQVRLDGQGIRPGRRVRAGQRIDFAFWQKPEPGVNTDYRVLFQDADLIVIDKPPDLPVHPSGIYREHTLYALLKRDFGADFTVHLVHRIDRETSGLLLLAGNPTSAAVLQKSFLARAVRKEYRVLVEGQFPRRLTTDGWIGPDKASAVRKKRRFLGREEQPESPGHGWQTSRTDFELAAPIPRNAGKEAGSVSSQLSLVHCRLHTGRMHQIRATLCSLGYPVVGDRLYGVDDRLYIKFINDEETEEDRARLRLNRTALHSASMAFDHPATGEPLTFEAELPGDMRSLADV